MKFFIATLFVLTLTGCNSRFAQYQPLTIQVIPEKDGYSVQTMDCPAMDITPTSVVYEGCSVENSRFQSMVNPEKMLPGNLNKEPEPISATAD